MAWFTVQYRGSDGKTESVQIESADRAGVFAELKRRGITAIRVEEANGNVKPRKASPSGKASLSLGKGILAGIIIVGGALIACYFLMSDSAKPQVPKRTNTVSSGPDKTNPIPKRAVPVPAQEKPKKIHYWEQDSTNGLNEAQLRKWKFMHQPPPSYTNTTMATRQRAKYAIFDTVVENEIACLISIPSGAGLVGTPRYTERYIQDFMKSCEKPIIVTEEDDEYTANLKREMNKVKIELRQRMADGEDLGEILTESRREIQRLAQVRREIEAEMHKLIRETATSEADIDTCVEAANKLLESKGLAPVKVSPILKSVLRRSLSDATSREN